MRQRRDQMRLACPTGTMQEQRVAFMPRPTGANTLGNMAHRQPRRAVFRRRNPACEGLHGGCNRALPGRRGAFRGRAYYSENGGVSQAERMAFKSLIGNDLDCVGEGNVCGRKYTGLGYWGFDSLKRANRLGCEGSFLETAGPCTLTNRFW